VTSTTNYITAMGNAATTKKGDSTENVKEFLEKCKTEFEEKWNHPKHVSG